MTKLNTWHELNFKRMSEAFPPAHDSAALIVCVGEEIGELCAAVLGVTGEKKRKAHLTPADILDACADAATYLSLLVSSLGYADLVAALTLEGADPNVAPGRGMAPMTQIVRIQELLGGLCFSYRCGNRDAAVSYAARCYIALINVARSYGCADWQRLLFETFNMVSDRAGSSIKVTL